MSIEAGARCARHPSVAVDVCARCGSFVCAMCAEISASDEVYCAECYPKLNKPSSKARTYVIGGVGLVVLALVILVARRVFANA